MAVHVEDFHNEASSFDLYVTPDSLIELRDDVDYDLKQHGYNIKNIHILIEELFTRIMDKNHDKRVLAECVLLYDDDQVRIIVRDDGVLFNFIDENSEIDSLNSYVLNCLLENTKHKNYVLTTSFNRNGFVFEKENNIIEN